jgi:hypothetical protein
MSCQGRRLVITRYEWRFVVYFLTKTCLQNQLQRSHRQKCFEFLLEHNQHFLVVTAVGWHKQNKQKKYADSAMPYDRKNMAT